MGSEPIPVIVNRCPALHISSLINYDCYYYRTTPIKLYEKQERTRLEWLSTMNRHYPWGSPHIVLKCEEIKNVINT
jgi:hypothetical protein